MFNILNNITEETYKAMLPYIKENFEIAKKYCPILSAPRLRAKIVKYTKDSTFCITSAVIKKLVFAVIFLLETMYLLYQINTLK